MRRVKRASGGRLRAASLVEAVVAAVVLLIAFTAAMELLPRLTLRGDDALAVAEAEYRAMCAFDKYGSGVWPAGTYVERYGGGEATVRVEPYRQYNDVQLITIEVRIDGSRKRIVHRQLVDGSATESSASGSCSQRPTASAAQRAEAQASCCTSIVQEARRH